MQYNYIYNTFPMYIVYIVYSHVYIFTVLQERKDANNSGQN